VDESGSFLGIPDDPDNRMGRYVLDEHGDPQPELNSLRWALWLEYSKDRIIAKTKVGEAEVSTVFLGLDHTPHHLRDIEPPRIFETMIFGDGDRYYCRRYATRAEAVAGHEEAVRMLRETADLEQLWEKR
jgi:hypothetical protein